MAAAIEFYFDFSSPYGYLAAQRIEEVVGEYEREILWKPFLLGAVFKITGVKPALDIPMKGDYARLDLARSARLYDTPFVLPETFPFMSVAACRATYWLNESDPEAARELIEALYDTAFGEGQSIREPAEVAAVAEELGHDPDAVLAAVQEPRIKDLLRREVEAAIAKGVFGSPYIIVDDEPFWGFDRLDDVALWLEMGGW
ncbi:MAG: 2-hydroxychromene-2-carboxylate isomerase [Proteobacteria bacterium]|nr:2-hydroxychromene-2-carboxylate isomerase [Pseudomonadota bacterium]